MSSSSPGTQMGAERGHQRQSEESLAHQQFALLPALCPHWPSLISKACPPLQPASQGLGCAVAPFSPTWAFPAAHGSVVHPILAAPALLFDSCSLPDSGAHSALVSPYLSGCSFYLSSPLLNTGMHRKSVLKLHPYQDLRFLHFWCRGPVASLPTPTL